MTGISRTGHTLGYHIFVDLTPLHPAGDNRRRDGSGFRTATEFPSTSHSRGRRKRQSPTILVWLQNLGKLQSYSESFKPHPMPGTGQWRTPTPSSGSLSTINPYTRTTPSHQGEHPVSFGAHGGYRKRKYRQVQLDSPGGPATPSPPSPPSSVKPSSQVYGSGNGPSRAASEQRDHATTTNQLDSGTQTRR